MTRASRLTPRVTQGDILETLGMKLRRKMYRSADVSIGPYAGIGGRLYNPPLIAPTAWQATFDYSAANGFGPGTIATSNGGQWLLLIAGISGATAPTGRAAYFNDGGGCRWMYYGVSPIAASSAFAPTITQQTAFPSGLSSTVGKYLVSEKPQYLKLRGATWVGATVSGVAYVPYGFTSDGTTKSISGAQLEFFPDDDFFAIAFGNAGGWFRLAVDEQPVKSGNFKSGVTANPNYFVMDFTAVGGKKLRKVTLDMGIAGAISTNINIVGVYTTAKGTLMVPPSKDDLTAVWVADSLDDGSSVGPCLAGNKTSQIFAKLAGIENMWSMSKGGTGLINKGVGSAFYTFIERIPQVLAVNPDIIFCPVSTNDISYGASAITAAMTQFLSGLRNGGFKGPIVVLGVWPVAGATGYAMAEAAAFAAVTAFGDSRVYTYSLASDPAGQLLTGTGTVTSVVGDGNQDVLIGPADAVHPIERGTEALAHRYFHAWRDAIVPNIR